MTALPRMLLALALLIRSATALAAPGERSAAEKLPELPKVPSLELAAPRAEDLAEIDAVLERVAGGDSEKREAATRELLELSPRLVPAMRRRLA